MKEYAILFTRSRQISEDQWQVYHPTLKLTESTTLGDILKFAKDNNYTTDDLKIIEMDVL